ncbi:hypothetical protein F4777DRAFT_601394 [Nemania sp. FL0916]|nr:hypothetical protein F4777DRAFT_601394 [Nemania sp. FL0916]
MLFTLPGNAITAAGFIAASVTVFVVTAVFVTIRVINGLTYSKQLFADDYLAIFALALQIVNFGLYIKLNINIANIANITVREFSQFLIAEAYIGGFAMYFAKLPVLVLFARLFGIRKWLRITVWTTIILGFAVFLAPLLYVSVECAASKVHDMPSLFVCIGASAQNGLVQGIASPIIDIIAFVTPLPIVFNLKLSTDKKIGLFVVFTTGIFAIAASLTALYYKVKVEQGDPNSNFSSYSIILSLVEAHVAIIVGCVPALRSFWTNQLSTLTVYSKIQSLLSSKQSSTGSRSTQKSSSQETGSSTDNIIQGNYMELYEANSHNNPNRQIGRSF